MPATGDRAGIYARESKDKAKSIEDQATEGEEAAAEHSWRIVARYTDGVSASRFGGKTRKGWQQLLADLDAGELDIVIAWEPSRADRDLETWVTFVSRCRARGVLIHLTGDGDTLDPRNPSHWHRLITGGVDAAMESEKISKRVRRGTGRAAAAGKPHGPAPYGYVRVIVGEERTPHGPKPVKDQRKSADAPIVVEIFERIARSDPLSAIVRDLDARGVQPPSGAAWSRYSVRTMATNVAYMGQRRHRTAREGEAPTDTRYDGTWPGLVDADLFYRAQAVLGRPDRHKTKPGRAKWLLSYIAHAACGAQIHVSPDHRGRGDRYVCHGDGCVSAAVATLDEITSRLLCGRFLTPDIRKVFSTDDAAARAARSEAAELRANLQGHYDEAAAGRLTAGGLSAMEARLLPLIADADKRAARSGVAPGAASELLAAAESGLLSTVRVTWDGLPMAARREVVAGLAVPVIDKAPRRLSRWADQDERLAMALAQLDGSRWVGDERTWGEIRRSAD